jgi:hypothetical protein
MIAVLAEEVDRHVAFSAVTFFAASTCAVAAEEVGVPLEIMAKRFARLFEERIHDVGLVMKLMPRHDNAA